MGRAERAEPELCQKATSALETARGPGCFDNNFFLMSVNSLLRLIIAALAVFGRYIDRQAQAL